MNRRGFMLLEGIIILGILLIFVFIVVPTIIREKKTFKEKEAQDLKQNVCAENCTPKEPVYSEPIGEYFFYEEKCVRRVGVDMFGCYGKCDKLEDIINYIWFFKIEERVGDQVKVAVLDYDTIGRDFKSIWVDEKNIFEYSNYQPEEYWRKEQREKIKKDLKKMGKK